MPDIFNPNEYQRGSVEMVGADPDPHLVLEALAVLHREACSVVPPEYRGRIRFSARPGTPMALSANARRHFMLWEYVPEALAS